MKIFKVTLFIVFITISLKSIAQRNDEVGVFLGPSFMQTDYGEAKNFSSSINNTGFGFAFAYIADFSDSRPNSTLGRVFSEHVKLRAELSYMKANFAYDGKPVEDGNIENAKFKAMKGNTKILSLGVYTEIYPFTLTDDKKLQPYILTGVAYVSSNPSLKSSMDLPNIYQPANENVFMDKQSTFSLTAGIGTRYKIDDIDLVFEYRFNSFMSDKIEGLDSDFSGDKHNDAQTIFNLGVVFHLY